MSSLWQSIVRRVFICVGAVAIVVLALRSAMGPFQLWPSHTTVNSPFVTENLFWIAIFILLCMRGVSAAAQAPNAGGFPGIPLAIALGVIALAFSRNLADPFLSDDYIILSSPSFTWPTFIAALSRPGGDGSFRPLGTVYYQMLKAVAGESPVKWHLAGLALHLLNSALVCIIAWRLWRDKAMATVSALVFGLHGTRPEAALWTAGNCDLLASACVLGSIVLALSSRGTRASALSPGFRPASGQAAFGLNAVSLLLVAAGILFKESAYALPLVAFCLLWPSRPLRNIHSYLIGSCATCAALLAWRWHLFHGPGGYIDRATGQPAILSLRPLTVAKALLLRTWAILLAPIDWDASMPWWMPVAIIASLLGLLVLVAGNRASVTRRMQLYLIAATCCAVLPAIHLALIGQSEMGSRILYLAGAPFALLIGSLTRRTWIVIAVMLAGMTGILEHNLNAWHRAALKADASCHDAAAQPDKPPPGTIEGVFFFQNGFAQCVAAHDAEKR